MSLDEKTLELISDGWEIIASGRVLVPFEAKHPKPTFSERVEGFAGCASGEMILDDDERWVQLRRRPDATA